MVAFWSLLLHVLQCALLCLPEFLWQCKLSKREIFVLHCDGQKKVDAMLWKAILFALATICMSPQKSFYTKDNAIILKNTDLVYIFQALVTHGKVILNFLIGIRVWGSSVYS